MSEGVQTVKARDSAEKLSDRVAALEKENFKLRLAAEERAATLAQLAHQLRTPLTSILGFAEILLSHEKLTPAQRNFCERIQNSAHQLRASVNQISETYQSQKTAPRTPESDAPESSLKD